jgi:hypothetical protein
MNRGRSVFAQLLDFIPFSHFDEARAAISYGPITNGENSAMAVNLRPLTEWVKPVTTRAPQAPTGV